MLRSYQIPVLTLLALLTAGTAQATVVTVTDDTGLPSATKWGTYPGENTGGGKAVISDTAPRDGNGSLEISGDRTRFQLGIQFTFGRTNLMPLSNVTGLSFDWRIAGGSISGYNPDYTPALRLLVQDGSQRSELVWEGAYNGTYGNTVRDAWYSTSFADNFYQTVAGVSGPTLSNGSQVNKTLASWIAGNYSPNAYVSGISVGDGSGAFPSYHAFVDDVTLGTTRGNTTYNFEVAATAVPEPASMALLLAGFGAVGLVRRRRTAR